MCSSFHPLITRKITSFTVKWSFSRTSKDGREMSFIYITVKAGVIHLHLLTFQPQQIN